MTRSRFKSGVKCRAITPRALRYVLIAGISLAAPVPAAYAQHLTPADSAAVVQALLQEYRASNGPVVRVSEFLSCGAPESWKPERLHEIQPCFSQAGASAIRAYAAQAGVDLVGASVPVPVCIWNPEDVSPKGLQLEILAPAHVSSELRIGLLARCMGGRGGFNGDFVEGSVYAVERINGAWRIVRRVASFTR